MDSINFLVKDLIKIADEMDRRGMYEAADMVDALIKSAAEKKDPPILKMKVRKTNEEDGSYDVVIYAPSGLSPYDPVVNAYIHKYGPLGEDAIIEYCETVANSVPHEPNMFKFRLRKAPKKSSSSQVGYVKLGGEVACALTKIADELDAAGETDLADAIDTLLV